MKSFLKYLIFFGIFMIPSLGLSANSVDGDGWHFSSPTSVEVEQETALLETEDTNKLAEVTVNQAENKESWQFSSSNKLEASSTVYEGPVPTVFEGVTTTVLESDDAIASNLAKETGKQAENEETWHFDSAVAVEVEKVSVEPKVVEPTVFEGVTTVLKKGTAKTGGARKFKLKNLSPVDPPDMVEEQLPLIQSEIDEWIFNTPVPVDVERVSILIETQHLRFLKRLSASIIDYSKLKKANKTRVVVFRSSLSKEYSEAVTIFINDRYLSSLKNNEYSETYVCSGGHKFDVFYAGKGKNVSKDVFTTNLNITGNKVSYLQIEEGPSGAKLAKYGENTYNYNKGVPIKPNERVHSRYVVTEECY